MRQARCGCGTNDLSNLAPVCPTWDRLVEEAIGPLVAELGLPMPEISEHDVHNFLSQ